MPTLIVSLTGRAPEASASLLSTYLHETRSQVIWHGMPVDGQSHAANKRREDALLPRNVSDHHRVICVNNS